MIKDKEVRESELSASTRRVLKQYFKDLDGERCGAVYDMVLASVEKPLIEVVLEHVDGNQTRASELLGLNRNTLRKKMNLYGIE